MGLDIDKTVATRFYAGIVGDTGRFMYGKDLTSAFETSAYLAQNGADAQFLYGKMRLEGEV